jgi:hypothetical protein
LLVLVNFCFLPTDPRGEHFRETNNNFLKVADALWAEYILNKNKAYAS